MELEKARKKRITASDRYHFSWCARWILNRWRMKIVKRKLWRITFIEGEARKLLYNDGKVRELENEISPNSSLKDRRTVLRRT